MANNGDVLTWDSTATPKAKWDAPEAGVAATTVEAETSYGLSSAVGTDTEYARQDHTHGSPVALYGRESATECGTGTWEWWLPFGRSAKTQSTVGQTLTANRLYAFPFLWTRPGATLEGLGMRVSTLAAGKVFRFGIYDSTNSAAGAYYPGDLLVDGGEISVASTGAKKATGLSVSLPTGILWGAFVSDGAPILLAQGVDGSALILGCNDCVGEPFIHLYVAFSYAALPDPFPGSATTVFNTGGGGVSTSMLFGRFSG